MLLFMFYTIFAVLLAVLLGWRSLSLFFPETLQGPAEKTSFSLGLGLGLVTFVEFAFLYLNLQISPGRLIATIALAVIIPFFFMRKRRCVISEHKNETFNLFSKIMLFFIIAQGAWVAIKAFNLPILDDDAILIWGSKAKIIFFSNLSGASLGTIASKIGHTPMGNYPLLIPLLENYINIFLGVWNDLYFKIIFLLYYFLLILTFYSVLKKITNKNYAVIFTFFLAGLNFIAEQSTWGMSDLAFTYYYFTSSALILLWIKYEKSYYLYLSAVFAGFSVWTKNEGYPSLLINLLIIVLFIIFNFNAGKKKLFKKLAVFVLIALPIVLLVIYYQGLTQAQEGILNSHTLSFGRFMQNLERVPFILNKFQKQLLGAPNKWNLTGYLFIFALLMNFKKAFQPVYSYALLAIILNFSLYTAVYILTPIDLDFHMNTSQNRVLMHFVPLMLFFSAGLMYEKN